MSDTPPESPQDSAQESPATTSNSLRARLGSSPSQPPPKELSLADRKTLAEARLNGTLKGWRIVRLLGVGPVSAAYEAVRTQAGPGVTVVAATKYVPLEQFGTLVEAGLEVVGENRAQDLERKHAAYGGAFRWHFIGQLQSNKAKEAVACRGHAISSSEANPRRPTRRLARRNGRLRRELGAASVIPDLFAPISP